MKLKDMVELLSNNDACVVLKVKDGQEMNLISLGCFNGDEVMMRLTKGRDQPESGSGGTGNEGRP